MTPERWKQISRIYEDARLRAASDRVAFLTEACAGDPSLQREVQGAARSADVAHRTRGPDAISDRTRDRYR